MKLQILTIGILVAALTTFVPAQSVVITGKKVTYTRPKPLVDFKRSFTVNYPKVKAATPALSRKIESAISYANVLKLNINEEIRDIQWLEEADYEVGYNRNGILSITLSANGTGAYPSSFSKVVVVDLKTGKRQAPSDVFINLAGLARLVRAAQKKEIAESIEEIKKNPDYGEANPEELFQNADFRASNLEGFAVDGRGVTFSYDYGFPHVIMALQPAGNYSFTWLQLKPFIKRSGLLGRFIR